MADAFPSKTIHVVWDNLNTHGDGKTARWTRFNEHNSGRFRFVRTHAADVVHRDIKPDNVVLVGGTWKLADFGIAKHVPRVQTKYTFFQHHTPGYAPPEQVDGAPAAPSMDVYAFGKVLAFMLSGQTDPDHMRHVALRHLARDCTHRSPDQRLNLDEIRRALDRVQA